MIYGLIDRNIHEHYTYMSTVFQAIKNKQTQYNWLISDCECYPQNTEIGQLFNQKYCWLSGDELTKLVAKEDFQWIWGVLCGFEKDIPLDEILKFPLPSARDCNSYYNNPVSLQHHLSSLEIIPSDSSWTLLVSKDKTIIEHYLSEYPKAEILSVFNQEQF